MPRTPPDPDALAVAPSLSTAYEIAASEFNALGLCEQVPAAVSSFWGRPFQVIHGDRFAAALGDAGVQPEYFGNTTQWIDSTDALHPRYVRQFAALYTWRGKRTGAARVGSRKARVGTDFLCSACSPITLTIASMDQRDQPGRVHIATWCRRWLGAEPADVLFHQGHLSQVTGMRLDNGVAVVLKLRPPSERLVACIAVQRHLWAAGFPCPEPLAGPEPLGRFSATAEVLIEGGAQLGLTHDDAPRLFAEALARLVRLAPPLASLATLEPSLPWVGWDHKEPGTWPVPDDIEVDLNAHLGPAWLEDAGTRVRRRLNRPSALPTLVGHADWESQNVRWVERRLHVVHDWDSIVAQREATIAGAASAVFTATGAPNTSATIQQSECFLMAYAHARGSAWTDEERELAWAAGLWVRVFNAKKATLRSGGETPSPSRLRLEAEVGERLRRAGA